VRLLFIIFAVFFPGYAFCQDPILLFPYSNPVLLNPAFSGGNNGLSIYSNYEYWRKGPGFGATTADLPIDALSGGVALTFTKEWFGVSGDLTFANSFAHAIKLSDKISIRVGATIGFFRRSIDISKIDFNQVIYDPAGPTIAERMPYLGPKTNFNGGIGMLLSGEQFNAGLTANNLFEPDNTIFAKENTILPRRYTIHGSYTYTWNNWNFSPYLAMHLNSNFITRRNIGATLNRSWYSLGLSHETFWGYNFLAGINLKNHLRFGYCHSIEYPYSPNFYLTAVLPYKKEMSRLKPANFPVF
jgi:type IX secretion system PorP/SprF family membrane protein